MAAEGAGDAGEGSMEGRGCVSPESIMREA
jgi:hypothetical protein